MDIPFALGVNRDQQGALQQSSATGFALPGSVEGAHLATSLEDGTAIRAIRFP